MKKIAHFLSALVLSFIIPTLASAHEVYVLNKDEIADGFSNHSLNIFTALQSTENLKLFLIVSVCVGVVFVANLFFRHYAWGDALRRFFEKGHVFGPIFVRLAVSVAFFYSAAEWSFLGPELSLHDFPYGGIIRIVLFVLSALFFFGLFVEWAAIVGLGIFCIAIYKYGWYMLSYANYFGEFIVLIMFGLRVFSFDKLFFGEGKRFASLEKYKTTIVRICYGFALAFAAIYIKLLNPALTYEVVTQYNLTQFTCLFPSDPLFVVLGAFLAELTIAIFVMIGFQLRLTVFISLIFFTMSLLFFKEAVWPHFLLYGISFSLIFNKEVLTLDNLIDKYWPFRKKI